MSQSSKVVHPFFQLQQKKQNEALNSSTIVNNLSVYKSPTPPTPTPLLPQTIEPEPAVKRTLRQRVKKVETPPEIPPTVTKKVTKATVPENKKATVTRATVTEKKTNNKKATVKKTQIPTVKKINKNPPHVPAVASCSTPYHVPMEKPKFYSDTLEYKAQQQHAALFNFYGRINKHEKWYDHDFSRLDRAIYGHAHTPRFLLNDEHDQDYTRHLKPTLDLKEFIHQHQHAFFKKMHSSRENTTHQNKRGSKKYELNITTSEELKEFLDITFPHWQTFSSCVILSQLVLNKQNRKKTNVQRSWNDLYRPKSVNGLLGERHNYVYLKDWLHQMRIEPMSAPTKKTTTKKKKKKNLQDLNDLFIHGDDNTDDDDFMPIKKSAKQLKQESMKSNIILISGDHGVGKTASIYTAADQLGFEVFEINSGSRRSGKDIMSMVGEMSKSHLVTFDLNPPTPTTPKVEPTTTKVKKLKLNPCLSNSSLTDQSNDHNNKSGLLKHFLRKKESPTTTPTTKSTLLSNGPKQSLILFEEVDLLFEEDKAFWTSVIELSQKSKRPIIMTCNDPEQIPFESLCLQVVLEMKPPTEAELLPYLWLICYSEGYIVDPADIICLVAILGRDIRRLIQTLEMYVKNEEPIFERYLSIDSTSNIKSKCIPSRVAVDTYRLARYRFNELSDTDMIEYDDLESIEKALEDNAFIDTWLGYKENGDMVHESVKDQINGFTSLWFEDDEENESKLILNELECDATIINSFGVKSNSWSNIILDESSHWDEVCDARSHYFTSISDAIEKLLSIQFIYQPNEQIIMMEYIPFIKQMITANNMKSKSTRSKRKRLYLPLSDDAIQILTCHPPIIDETEFWIQRLHSL